MVRQTCLAFVFLTTGFTAMAQTVLKESDFLPFNAKAAAVGQLLFYDPILSGNRNISCGTCHHHDLASGDGLSLGIGEGGQGLGQKRRPGSGQNRIERRVPRNAPALWNLGAKEIRVLFHDGRVSKSDQFGNGFNTPVDGALPEGLISILAAQALMPPLSDVEMAGEPHENEVSRAARRRPQDAWALLSARVQALETYDILLRDAYPDISYGEVEIEHIANAIGEFINSEYRSFDTPYDMYLAGDTAALTTEQRAGMELFFGKAECSTCHRGRLLSDQKFHALGLPQFGPGRTRKFDPKPRDAGRINETNRLEDAYKFRTPMLRNVVLNGPYGHNGAYKSLEEIIRHHLDPVAALENWTIDQAGLPEITTVITDDFIISQDERETKRLVLSINIKPQNLSDEEVAQIVAFMSALTGKDSVNGRLGLPATVPSGLPVD